MEKEALFWLRRHYKGSIMSSPSFFFKPLIVFSNPYDCEPVLKALEDIPYDQLHLNYMPYPKNYFEGRKFFLENQQYTHYFVQSPDLIPVKEDFEKMCEYVKKNNPPVYCGCCNVDKKKHKDHIAACYRLPMLEYENRVYRWLAESQRQQILENFERLPVKFNGLTSTFIRRDIVEKIPFTKLPYPTDERPIWESRGGYAADLAFAHYCDYMDIPILMDFRFKWEHLRYWGELQVGKKTPTIIHKRKQKHP